MIIRPQQRLRNLLFYNNLVFILMAFSILCLLTSVSLKNVSVKSIDLPKQEGVIVGPIKVNDNKTQIYKVDASWHGDNSSKYLSGEVLDEDKDTIYEFGKDFWHETGYDSDGHWSESDRYLEAYLTFKEKGTYYIQFNTEEHNMSDVQIRLTLMKGSYVAHSMIGTIVLLLALAIFCALNKQWVRDIAEVINEKLEEMSDD